MKKIALVKSKNGIWKSFQKVLNERDFDVTLIDIFASKDLELLLNEKWDGFIWSAKHTPKIKNLAKKIIYLFDEEIKTNVYPNWHSYSHYDDKVTQYFLFNSFNFPIPVTNVFFNKEDANLFFKTTNYPLIFKSAHGAGSTNVSIIKTESQAKKKSNQIFGKGLKTFFSGETQKGYLLVQEFEKNNTGDYRLVCYGKEILGFFRENRSNEPLASGSHKFTFKEIPNDLLTLIYELSCKMNYLVMSYDIIKNNNDQWVITEISVVYGDIKEAAYDNAKVYRLNDEDKWEEINDSFNHYERVANYIIESWNFNE